MSAKDKLEIGLKPDAPYRRDNLPESQPDPEEAKELADQPKADDDKTQKQRQEARQQREERERDAANAPDDKLPDQ